MKGLRRGIAVYEAAAGAVGIVGFLLSVPAVAAGVVPLGVFLALSAAALASIVAGVGLWRRAPRGLALSGAVQALQAPILSAPGLAYSLGLTFRLELGWRGRGAPDLPINHFLLRVGANEYGPMAALNVPAAVMLLLLVALWRTDRSAPAPIGSATAT
jgi:hypothetical protein